MSPLVQHIEVNIMNEIKYYPLDLDPFARAHVVLNGNTVLFEDHMGHRFAVSSKRLRRLWYCQYRLFWDCVSHYIEVTWNDDPR